MASARPEPGTGGPTVEFLRAKPVLKTGVIRYPTPFHQDYMYWLGAPKISVWLAIDDAQESNGCLKVLPGSHLLEMAHDEFEEKVGFDYRLRDEQVEAAARELGREAISLPLQSGGSIFFSDRLAHASHANTSGADRFSFIPTYRDGDVADDSKVWEVSLRTA